jgi:Domain of unknown function (DUF4160)
VITTYHREHEPPLFHARHAGHKITVRFADGAVDGSFPPRALGHVMEWWGLVSAPVILRSAATKNLWRAILKGTNTDPSLRSG